MRSEGYGSWSVCVRGYSRTTGYEAAYQTLQCYKRMKTKMAIFLKRQRSSARNWLSPRPRSVAQPIKLVVRMRIDYDLILCTFGGSGSHNEWHVWTPSYCN